MILIGSVGVAASIGPIKRAGLFHVVFFYTELMDLPVSKDHAAYTMRTIVHLTLSDACFFYFVRGNSPARVVAKSRSGDEVNRQKRYLNETNLRERDANPGSSAS